MLPTASRGATLQSSWAVKIHFVFPFFKYQVIGEEEKRRYGNGIIFRCVATVKQAMKKCDKPALAGIC